MKQTQGHGKGLTPSRYLDLALSIKLKGQGADFCFVLGFRKAPWKEGKNCQAYSSQFILFSKLLVQIGSESEQRTDLLLLRILIPHVVVNLTGAGWLLRLSCTVVLRISKMFDINWQVKAGDRFFCVTLELSWYLPVFHQLPGAMVLLIGTVFL